MVKKINQFVLYSIVMAVFVCCQGCPAENGSAAAVDETAVTDETTVTDNLKDALTAYNWPSYVGDGVGIWVRIDRQEVLLIDNNQLVKQYVCSTAKAGIGSKQNSGQTPLGWHQVGAKIGDTLPAGAILKDRQWTGRVWTTGQESQEDLILSRILWLEGLETGKNRGGDVDSRSRYIYIHGTNQVELLGQPASAGCVRLNPQEVIDLYDRVDKGCCVLITKE